MAVRLYVHRWIDGDPIIDLIEANGLQVMSTSKQVSQCGDQGVPVIPIVCVRVRGDVAVLDQLDGLVADSPIVYRIPRYRMDKLISTIPVGTRNAIISKINEHGIPLNWFSGCVTWRDFLTRLLQWVRAKAKMPDQFADEETA